MPDKNTKLKQLRIKMRAVKIIAFALALLVIAFIGLLWFARPDTSVIEKRTLTKFPTLTWSSFWDGSFFKGVDTWYADTFPIREVLISGSQKLESYYGNRSDQIIGDKIIADEIPDISDEPEPSAQPVTPADPSPAPTEEVQPPTPNVQPIQPDEPLPDGTVSDIGELQGNIYITNNCGYGLYYFSRDATDNFIDVMNTVYYNIKDKVNMYVLICPISAGVMLDDTVLDDMGCSNEKTAIDYMYGKMDKGIHTIAAFDNLKKHNAEYIYFRTDHHWTALGAYYAYEEFCKEKGIAPHDIDTFETMEFPNFIGTFYSNSNNCSALLENPDTVIGYIPKGTNEMVMHTEDGEVYDWWIVNDVSDWDNSVLYSAFAGSDNPFSYAHNETITDGSAVLVIKDSYGNAFIPWLVDHYEYIYWIDARYTDNTILQMVEDYGIDDVIYEAQIYNCSSEYMQGRYLQIGS